MTLEAPTEERDELLEFTVNCRVFPGGRLSLKPFPTHASEYFKPHSLRRIRNIRCFYSQGPSVADSACTGVLVCDIFHLGCHGNCHRRMGQSGSISVFAALLQSDSALLFPTCEGNEPLMNSLHNCIFILPPSSAAGLGDMAVSNTIGSNVFDILVGLGVPWALQTICINYGSVVKISFFCHTVHQTFCVWILPIKVQQQSLFFFFFFWKLQRNKCD